MKNCCCRTDLKLGGLIISYIELICLVCVASTLLYSIVFVGLNRSDYSFNFCLIVVNLIMVAAVAICIYGIIKGKPRFMLPHIYLSMQMLFLLGIKMLYNTISELVKFAEYGTDWRVYRSAFVRLIGLGIAFGILLYFTRVIRSLYKLIKENQSDQLPTIDRVESTQRLDP